MKKFSIVINGRDVAYLKRVSYGTPVIFWADDHKIGKAYYTQAVAKGWVTTCKRFFDDVEMVGP